MGEGLKRRVIGAIVLLALLILLAPALFRGGDTHPLVATKSAPELPQPEPPPVPAFVEQLDVAPDAVQVVASPKEARLEQKNAAPAKPVGVDDKGHLKAWALRLATFADKNNALKLEQQLKGEGYSAYQKRMVTAQGKTLYRVYIGPEVRPDELQQIKAVIHKESGLEGIVVRFVP